jgi:hypothetical protein
MFRNFDVKFRNFIAMFRNFDVKFRKHGIVLYNTTICKIEYYIQRGKFLREKGQGGGRLVAIVKSKN